MKTQTYEVTLVIPSLTAAAIGLAIIYFVGVWVYDIKTNNYRGWISSPRWYAWIWPAVVGFLAGVIVYEIVREQWRRLTAR